LGGCAPLGFWYGNLPSAISAPKNGRSTADGGWLKINLEFCDKILYYLLCYLIEILDIFTEALNNLLKTNPVRGG